MYYFYGKINRGHMFICCMEVVRILESPLWEVLLYTKKGNKIIHV